jgi:hypothetical protein
MNHMKNEKLWLEAHQYYPDLDESKLTSIFYFTLIWNLFEKNCCDENAQINEHAPGLAVWHVGDGGPGRGAVVAFAC